MLIYKIFRDDEWQVLQSMGETTGAPIDVADGFIHFSDATQVKTTARLYFEGVQNLWLAAVDPAPLGDDLVWEKSRGGALFPHLFRSLKMIDVLWCNPLPLGADGHEFPKDLI